MRKKRVWRYYCDYCGKGSCSAGAMKQHEAHCTMNPYRTCRVCALMSGEKEAPPSPMKKMLAVLPPVEAITEISPLTGCRIVGEKGHDVLQTVIERLEEAADGCPACMLAALRQKGYLDFLPGSLFDYDKRMKTVFAEVNEAARSAMGY